MTPLAWFFLAGWVVSYVWLAVGGWVHIGRAFDRGYALGREHAREIRQGVIRFDRDLSPEDAALLAETWRRIYGPEAS